MDVETLQALGPTRRAALLDRDAGLAEIEAAVADIVETVRARGDQALRSYAEEFDEVSVGGIEITEDVDRAREEVDGETLAAIETAAENIRAFHARQVPDDWRYEEAGATLGRRFRPLERVGVYVPGGTATYPSSALMTVVPATVAGVEQIAVATPPGDPVNPVTLAALNVAGADEVYRVGGAQAIAALAYGTESVPAVDRIVGPGNRWVAGAKRHVRRDVPVDLVAGPSEILILADETAEPAYLAADLLAQAEHDPHSPVVLVTDAEDIATRTADRLADMISEAERADIAREALAQDASGIFEARSMSEAIAFAEEFAPEHLSIQADDDEAILDRVDSAGSVFLGPHTPVAAGDYASGTNHVLPTHGTARVRGGLAVEDFIRAQTVQRLSRNGLAELGPTIETLARAEGLPAHGDSVAVRLEERD